MKFDLSDENLDQIEVMSSYGVSVEEMPAIIGIEYDVLMNSVMKGEAGKRIKRGQARAGFQVKQKALEMAKSGSHPYMTALWLKNNAGWSDINWQRKGRGGKP